MAVSSLSEISSQESRRYLNKGIILHLAIAIAINIAVIYFFPPLARKYWNFMSEYLPSKGLNFDHLYIFHGLGQGYGLQFICHGFFCMCYYFNWPWMEKYKAV